MSRMNRIFGVCIMTLALGLSTSSCKKCYQCTVLDEDNVAIFEYREVCATKRDYENYVSRCEAEYGQFEFNCSCGVVQ